MQKIDMHSTRSCKKIPQWRVPVLKEVISIEMVKTALGELFCNREETDQRWIDQMAQFVMDFFGFEDRILDNKLTPRDRDIFYMLEGVDLLKTEMEEATIQKGKIWRIHYWVLNRDKISELVNKEGVVDETREEISEETIYDKLSDQFWYRG
jgi:hypothetical protein